MLPEHVGQLAPERLGLHAPDGMEHDLDRRVGQADGVPEDRVPAEDAQQRLGGGPQVLGPVDDSVSLVAQLESGPVDRPPADRSCAHGAPSCDGCGTPAGPGCAR